MDELTGAGDVDQDGQADLVARQIDTGDIWLYGGTGKEVAAPAPRILTGPGRNGWAHGMRSSAWGMSTATIGMTSRLPS